MPNHVANILKINEDATKVAAFLEAVKSEESAFDFNKIVPMPETFIKYDTTNHPNGRGLVIGEQLNPWDKNSPIVTNELIKEFKKATKEQAKMYGCVGWYDWSRHYWGTKWKAYDIEVEVDEIRFNTAWNAPMPIYVAIADLFPDYDFEVVYADEDYGYNCGMVSIEHGDIFINNPDGGSDEAMDLYFETHPYNEGELIKDEKGKWVWREE